MSQPVQLICWSFFHVSASTFITNTSRELCYGTIKSLTLTLTETQMLTPDYGRNESRGKDGLIILSLNIPVFVVLVRL